MHAAPGTKVHAGKSNKVIIFRCFAKEDAWPLVVPAKRYYMDVFHWSSYRPYVVVESDFIN